MAALLDKIKKYLEERTEEQSAYILAVISGLLSICSIKFFNREYGTVFLIISTFLLCYGFIVFLTPFLRGVLESFIGKVVVPGIVVAGSTFSLSLAKTSINASFQVPSSPFVHTQALLSMLLAPIVALILVGVVSNCKYYLLADIAVFSFR